MPEYFSLSNKPDIEQLFTQKQISGIQQDIVSELESLTGEMITQEVLITNKDYPAYPFRIDIVIGSPDGKQLAVEIDGYHHLRPENVKRDARKTAKMESMGYEVMRIPYEIPKELVYNRLEGTERRYTELKYKMWRADFIKSIAKQIVDNYTNI